MDMGNLWKSPTTISISMELSMGGSILWEIFQPCLITPEGTRLDSEDSRQALLLFSASGKSSLAASCNLGVLML
jgi:hypothetical protein